MSKQHEIARRILEEKERAAVDPKGQVPSYFKLRRQYANKLNEMSLAGKSRGMIITKTDLVELGIERLYAQYEVDGITSVLLGQHGSESSYDYR